MKYTNVRMKCTCLFHWNARVRVIEMHVHSIDMHVHVILYLFEKSTELQTNNRLHKTKNNKTNNKKTTNNISNKKEGEAE